MKIGYSDADRKYICERDYARAIDCLVDARLVACERENHGLGMLIEEALSCVKNIGVFADINGQRRLGVCE